MRGSHMLLWSTTQVLWVLRVTSHKICRLRVRWKLIFDTLVPNVCDRAFAVVLWDYNGKVLFPGLKACWDSEANTRLQRLVSNLNVTRWTSLLLFDIKLVVFPKCSYFMIIYRNVMGPDLKRPAPNPSFLSVWISFFETHWVRVWVGLHLKNKLRVRIRVQTLKLRLGSKPYL